MHLSITNFNGNPNLGLYGIATSKYLLLGKDVPKTHDKTIAEVFGKEVKHINIAGTGLLGVFCLWTGEKLLIPQITFDTELEVLKELSIPFEVIDTELTALGNNVLLGVQGAILNPDFTDKDEEILGETLSLPCKRDTIVEVEAVGSIGVIRGDKGLFHRDIPPQKLRELEEFLGLRITTGTLNMGNPYIKSAIIVDEKGMIVGDASGGPEIQNADEALGFI